MLSAFSAVNDVPFELRIALRYLTARRKQAFISLISGVSVLGVMVGVMALMVAVTGIVHLIKAVLPREVEERKPFDPDKVSST